MLFLILPLTCRQAHIAHERSLHPSGFCWVVAPASVKTVMNVAGVTNTRAKAACPLAAIGRRNSAPYERQLGRLRRMHSQVGHVTVSRG